MKRLIFSPFILSFFQLWAQPYSDCATALNICSKQAIHIDSVMDAGADNTELDAAPCFNNGAPGNVENNSCWIRFAAAQSGTLFFTITPDTIQDDIDFVLFQLGDTGVCHQKQILRCMAAGASFGSDSSACLGPTGLMPGETDTFEDAGCLDTTDNNFLAPVFLIKDTTYALCVQNFSGFNGFRIEFCGTAMLGCEMDTCAALTATGAPPKPTHRILKLYPNPVSDATIKLEIETEEPENMEFTLVNLLGQPVRRTQCSMPSGRSTQEFPVENLPTGTYWLQITGRMAITARQLWIRNTLD